MLDIFSLSVSKPLPIYYIISLYPIVTALMPVKFFFYLLVIPAFNASINSCVCQYFFQTIKKTYFAYIGRCLHSFHIKVSRILEYDPLLCQRALIGDRTARNVRRK